MNRVLRYFELKNDVILRKIFRSGTVYDKRYFLYEINSIELKALFLTITLSLLV